jgi:hypothetical protein
MAGKSDAVAALLDTGANAKDAPLYHAVLKNQVEIVQVLVAAGVDPTNPISQDWMSSGVTFSGGIAVRKVNPTPLDMARKKMSEYAKWPANLPLPDNGDGPMPLDVARKKNSEIVKLLEQAARSKPPQNPSAP